MKNTQAQVVHRLNIADGHRSVRHVFVHDMIVNSFIGVHGFEHDQEQRVRINLDLAVGEGNQVINDDIKNVICYEKLAEGVKAIISEGHINLVETLAERIADMCLERPQVISTRVRVEKLDILPDAESVGVEIERFRG